MPRSAVALVVSLFLGIADARAEPARDAAGLVDTLMHVALQSLRDKQLTPRARQERFATILENDFDLPRFAQFVTGRYWNTANQTDQQQFVGVLERWIIVTYTERFSTYAGDGLKVTGSRPDSGTTATVSSQLARSDGSPIDIEWRVRHQADDYRVVDVSVEGVSMLLTHREEFGSVIQKNGGTVAGLTRALENKLADSDGAVSPHCQGSCRLRTDRP